MRRVQDTLRKFSRWDLEASLDDVRSLFAVPEASKYKKVWVYRDGEDDFYILGERDSTPEEDEAERKMQQGIADGEYKHYLELKRKYEGE